MTYILYFMAYSEFLIIKKQFLIIAYVGVLLCGLGLVAPASADVIYFKPGVPIPKKMKGWGYNFMHPISGRISVAYMGRINRVYPGSAGTRIKFEPAKVKMVNVSWDENDYRLRQQPKVEWAGPKNGSLIKVSDLHRIEHEVDGPQDLRFAFSNRDVLLRRWLSNKDIDIGEELFRTYFLAAGWCGRLSFADGGSRGPAGGLAGYLVEAGSAFNRRPCPVVRRRLRPQKTPCSPVLRIGSQWLPPDPVGDGHQIPGVIIHARRRPGLSIQSPRAGGRSRDQPLWSLRYGGQQ